MIELWAGGCPAILLRQAGPSAGKPFAPAHEPSAARIPKVAKILPGQLGPAESGPAEIDLIAKEDPPGPPPDPVNDNPMSAVGILMADCRNDRESRFDGRPDPDVIQIGSDRNSDAIAAE